MGDLILMDVVRTANELLPRLYTAACGEGEWTDFLGPLAEATKSGMAHVISLTGVEARPSGGPPTVRRQWFQQVGFTPEFSRALVEWGHADPWFVALASDNFARAGRVETGSWCHGKRRSNPISDLRLGRPSGPTLITALSSVRESLLPAD